MNITITGITFKDGTVVYFNPITGTKCNNYNVSNSTDEYNSGCMKWYIFGYASGNTVNLLLDHNTTNRYQWYSVHLNVYGPSSNFLAKLKSDTASWVGVPLRTGTYSVNQSGYTNGATYTINYNGYRARLIAATEVAHIVDVSSFTDKTNVDSLYFDSKSATASTTCKNGNISGCHYGWLYGRTYPQCTSYGNDSTKSDSRLRTEEFWTATAVNDGAGGNAWMVEYYASLARWGTANNFGGGIRPVITINKTLLD